MRMATDKNLKVWRVRGEIEFIPIVQHVNGYGTEMSFLDFRNRIGPIPLIVIAADRDNRIQSVELLQNFRASNVAGVKNDIDVLKNLKHFGPQQAMSVGNDAGDLIH